MSREWLPNEEHLTVRCPYCGEYSFKERERAVADTLKYYEFFADSSRTCRLCKKTVYKPTKWRLLTTFLASSCALPIWLGAYFESFLLGLIGLVVIIAAALLVNKYTPFEITYGDKKKFKHIVIGIKNKKGALWPRYRSGEIYLITPNKHSYKKQIIAQLEKNYRNKMTFRVIKNVDLDLQIGQILYILTDNNHIIEGAFEKEIPAINTML
ncbi:MAG: hypothetical protein IJF58_04000 [Clostridia bacterium]|nr:hypothetical protein [Clostridia bacterium]